MANNLAPTLARFVRERAYRAGDLRRIEREAAEAHETVNAAMRALRAVKRRKDAVSARIAELDARIEELAAFDPEAIRAIARTPRLGHFQHGEFTGELVRVLKGAKQAMPTRRIVSALVTHFGLPYSTPTERDSTRRRVVERLRILSRKGAIQRLHATNQSLEGRWLWVGL